MSINSADIASAIVKIRFPEEIICLKCRVPGSYSLKDNQYKCASCGYRFRILTGTVLEKYKIDFETLCILLLAFIENWPADKITHKTGISMKTIYKCFYDIRISLLQDLPEAQKNLFIRELTMEQENQLVIGVMGRKQAEIIPLSHLTPKLLKQGVKDGSLLMIGPYIGFITKKGVIRSVEPEYIETPLKTQIIDFIGWYLNESQDEVSRNQYRVKNFALYLKGREFIFNYKDLSYTQLMLKLLEKLIPPVYSNNISIFGQSY